jgi:hypothetical protein
VVLTEKFLRANKSILIGAGVASTSAFAAFALEPSQVLLIEKGPTVLKPQFQLTETFNDNVTYRDTNRLADAITVISPGLVFQLGNKDLNYINISYFFDRLQYAANPELSGNGQRFGTGVHWSPNRLTLDGRDSIEFASTPLGGGISLSGEKVDRVNFFDLYRLSYDFSEKTGLYIQALHQAVDYQQDIALYDQRTIQGTAGFQYRALPRTYFFGEMYYGETENDKNTEHIANYPTANFAGFFLGARGRFTEHLGGMIKAGYEHREYASADASPGIPALHGEPLDAPVVELGVDWRISDKTLLALNYSRLQNESVQVVSTNNSTASYTYNTIAASWRQELGNEGRMHLDARAAYITADYDTIERHDDMYNLGLTLTYDVKLWLRVIGKYDFESLDTNDRSITDYFVNRVSLGMQLGF